MGDQAYSIPHASKHQIQWSVLWCKYFITPTYLCNFKLQTQIQLYGTNKVSKSSNLKIASHLVPSYRPIKPDQIDLERPLLRANGPKSLLFLPFYLPPFQSDTVLKTEIDIKQFWSRGVREQCHIHPKSAHKLGKSLLSCCRDLTVLTMPVPRQYRSKRIYWDKTAYR